MTKQFSACNWVPSRVTEEQLDICVATGSLAKKEVIHWRAPGPENPPEPKDGEVVVFVDHLGRHSTKFSIGSICKLCTTVQIEEIPKQFNCGLLLKISLAKYLEIANIGQSPFSSLEHLLRIEKPIWI